jgi:hypothetical protein
MANQRFTAHPSLIVYLSNFYSVGQLELFYCTLTDPSPLPGYSDRKRGEYADAIAKLLGKTPMEPEPTPAKQMTMETEKVPAPERPKIELDKAKKLADSLVFQLEDYCEKIYVAGSIRRLKPEVKDIELVVLPKKFSPTDFSLFGGVAQPAQVSPAFRRTVESFGNVIKGKPDGKYMQIEMPRIVLDLFMPSRVDFYRQFAIRTGSADYSARVIAGGWKRKGWCGTPDGLRLITDCEEKNSTWKCVNPNPQLPPVWESEREFFDWLEVKWVAPEKRI